MLDARTRSVLLVPVVITFLLARGSCDCQLGSSRFIREAIFDDVIPSDNLIVTMNDVSAERVCRVECKRTQRCMSFSYNVDGTCVLYSKKFAHNARYLPATGSRHYYLVRPTADCPVDDGYVLLESLKLCFKIFSQQKTYNKSRDFCRQSGYRLVVLDTDEKNKAVIDYIVSHTDEDYLYIGLTDEAVDGMFVWEDGSTASVTKWYTGEPMDTSGADCAMLRPRLNVWIARICSYVHGYICEKPL